MKLKQLIPYLLAVSLSLFSLSNCEQKTPAEEAADEVGDAMEDSADEIGDAIEDATN